jgi:excisionase family DNA binding protein
MTAPKILLTIREAADLIGFSQATVRREINHERLKVVRIGVSLRIRPIDLNNWVDSFDDPDWRPLP